MKPSPLQPSPLVELVCAKCGKLVGTHVIQYAHKKNGRIYAEGSRRELLPHEGCDRRSPSFDLEVDW